MVAMKLAAAEQAIEKLLVAVRKLGTDDSSERADGPSAQNRITVPR
jgi:hypothetical protein